MRRKSGHAQIDAFAGVVIASDETGYGSWAGPLVVCAVAAPEGWEDPRVKDSKKLTDKLLSSLFQELHEDPRFIVEVSVTSAAAIDKIGVYPALLQAHEAVHRGVARRLNKPHISVIDGKFPLARIGFEPNEGVFCLPKGDTLVPECSLASIIAKVTRDRMMAVVHEKYPDYGFDSNVGYGGDEASLHARKLMELGPCPEHRRSYQPVALALSRRESESQTSFEDMMAGLPED